ncbi:MAG: hypothetical protein Q7S61_01335 [bacterium]|nr:hypothetical protein [bacterium]
MAAVAETRGQYSSEQKNNLVQFRRPHTSKEVVSVKIPEQALSSTYDVENDAQFLTEHPHLTIEQKKYYIQSQVETFLSEFVNKSRFKKLPGILKTDGTMQMCGADMTKMYRKAAKIAGPESREHAEEIGLDLISQSLVKKEIACWVSTPKIANYGFVFLLVRGNYSEELQGYPFSEYPLRYAEPLSSLSKSQSIYRSLEKTSQPDTNEKKFFRTYSDYLASPIFFENQAKLNVDNLCNLLEIDSHEIERSRKFEIEVIPEIQPFLEKFYNHLDTMSKLCPSHPEYSFHKQNADLFLGAMFNTAKDTKEKLEGTNKNRDVWTTPKATAQQGNDFSEEYVYRIAAARSNSRKLVIEGGSNCPVTKNNSGLFKDDVFNIKTISNYINEGSSLDSLLHKFDTKDTYDDYQCPGCGITLSGESKTNQSAWREKCHNCDLKFRCADEEEKAA